MKNRECPYCHKKVSLRKCIKYIIKGTKYSTTCNHCGQQLWLEKEPLPFMYCVSAGFFIMYLPMQFFLYLNPAKRNVLDLKNETCKNREKRNVLKISHTRHFKTTKKQSKTGCFYSF